MKDTKQFILSFLLGFVLALLIVIPIFFFYVQDTHQKVSTIFNNIEGVQKLPDYSIINTH